MKKIILIISLLIISIFWINNTFAEEVITPATPINMTESGWPTWNTQWGSNNIEVKISADFSAVLPWTCFPANDDSQYICSVPKWIGWFQIVMAWLIKYVTFIASLSWVLFIVLNWVLYSMWWVDDSLKTESKKRIIKTLIWIVLLLMSWVILHIVAPWVYK